MPIKLPNIPIFSIPDKPLSLSTQEKIPIAEIIDDMVLLKDGGCAIILESTSLNFGLLSEREQEAVIYSYAGMINSLSFSIQIVVRTLRKDITSYLRYLDEAQKKITNPKLSTLMTAYKEFISETIKKKNVLGKRFFLVVPFSALELGVSKSFRAATTSSHAPAPFSKDYAVKKAKITLYPRRDHLIKQGARLGLKMRQLNNTELTELLFDVFNPKLPAKIVNDENEI